MRLCRAENILQALSMQALQGKSPLGTLSSSPSRFFFYHNASLLASRMH